MHWIWWIPIGLAAVVLADLAYGQAFRNGNMYLVELLLRLAGPS